MRQQAAHLTQYRGQHLVVSLRKELVGLPGQGELERRFRRAAAHRVFGHQTIALEYDELLANRVGREPEGARQVGRGRRAPAPQFGNDFSSS